MTPRPYNPLPYQPAMLAHLEANPKALLFAELGLGKTVVVLKRIADMILTGESKGALIISPLRVSRITWPEQCETWEHSHWLRVVNMNTPEGVAAWETGNADIYLTHYDVLSTREVQRRCNACGGRGCSRCTDGVTVTRHPGFCEKFLKGRKEIPVNMVVYDEISVFKAHDSVRAAAMRAYHHLFPYRIGMTGTPLGNTRLNLFNQVRMIDDGERLGKSFHSFRQRFFESDYMGYKWTIREGAAETLDRKISDIALVLLNEDHADLPPCFIHDVDVKLPPDAVKAYRKIEKELLLELEKGDIVALNAAVLANKLLQLTGGSCYGENREVHHIHDAKIKALLKKREEIGMRNPTLVIVGYKHESYRAMKTIPGARMFDEKDMAKWKRGEIHTWIADARSLSHGIDGLQLSCSNIIWFTPFWSSETVQQTIKRIHRRGNTKDTHVWRLVARMPDDTFTMDEYVVESNRETANEQSGMLAALKKLQRMHKEKQAKP